MPRNIIIIGQGRLDLNFGQDGQPSGATPGGVLLQSALKLAGKGHPVYFVSEAGRDAVGDSIVNALTEAGVNTVSIDRYTEGSTATAMTFADGREVWYGTYPSGNMSVAWPRIERGDIVIFGDAYTLEPRVHQPTMDLLRYARDMKSLVIYAPLYPSRLSHHVTHAMPDILDSFEMASMSIIDTETIKTLYRTDDIADAYRTHLSYYDTPTVYAGNGLISMYMPTLTECTDCSRDTTMPDLIAAAADSAVSLDVSDGEIRELQSTRMAEILKSISDNIEQLQK
ncbi:MAG: carbohydrate kinase family protein [Muribaculum sp.]|nr:carbohydrate kinase family protein [Muribaculum sp.]